jgi:CBS domain-containing protein
VTERNLVNEVLAKRKDPLKMKIKEIMSSPLITIDPDQPLTTAADLMKSKNIRKLPIAKDGILYGMITARDINDDFHEFVDNSVRDVLRYISIL